MNSLNLRKRAAFEIGVNFIVIVILSIAILSSGIYLFYKLYHSAVVFKDNVDQQTNERINALLDNGEMFIILDTSKTIPNNKADTFPYGISNKLGSEKIFQLNCVSSNYFQNAESNPVDAHWCGNDKIIQFTSSSTIPNNGHISRIIMITVPSSAQLGTYTVIFKITADGKDYGRPQLITISNK